MTTLINKAKYIAKKLKKSQIVIFPYQAIDKARRSLFFMNHEDRGSSLYTKHNKLVKLANQKFRIS